MTILSQTKIYKVTVTEIQVTEYETEKEVLAEERHYTDAEIEKEHQWMRTNYQEKYTKKLYGTRLIVASDKSEVNIFTIQVDKLELSKLVPAIFEATK